MKYRVLCSRTCTGAKGSIILLPPALAEELIEKGLVELVVDKPKPKKKKEKTEE